MFWDLKANPTGGALILWFKSGGQPCDFILADGPGPGSIIAYEGAMFAGEPAVRREPSD